jgi:hypothetical protein
VKAFTKTRKRMLKVLPSKRPLKYRRGDPDTRIVVDDSNSQI